MPATSSTISDGTPAAPTSAPGASNAHVERRYLVVPGTGSSRIHIVDTKADPRRPTLVKVIEPEELARKIGYAAPHTVHCGPDGIYVNALGSTGGDGPGGLFMLDHETFDVPRARGSGTAGRNTWPTTSPGTWARTR